MDSFEFPAVWSLPPFFTLQPVEETKQKQTIMWIDLIIQFQKHTRSKSISVHSPIFTNKNIDRKNQVDILNLKIF